MTEFTESVKNRQARKEQRLQTIEENRKAANARKEQRIDVAMIAAAETFKTLDQRDDPYAMHRAVEQMPTAVLIDIVARSSDTLLKQPTEETK